MGIITEKIEILVFQVSVATFEFFGGIEYTNGVDHLFIGEKLFAHVQERMSQAGEYPNLVDAEVLEIYLAMQEYNKVYPVLLTLRKFPLRGITE